MRPSEKLRPWLAPALVLAVAWAWIVWLHTGGVGRPSEASPVTVADFTSLDPAVAEAAPVTLPHDWPETHPEARAGRYGFEVEIAEVPPGGLSLYFPSINTRGRVYANGALVADASKFHGVTTHYWHVPRYVTLPAAVLRPGANLFVVELEPNDAGGGYLAAPYLGPDELLRPSFEVRRFLQVTGIQILVVAMVAFAAFMALLYVLRRKDSAYLWFAVVLGVFAFGFYNLLAIDAWIPKPSYRWVGSVTMAWLTVTIAIFVNRLLGVRHRRTERVLLAGATLGSIYFAVTLGTPGYTLALPLWSALVLGVGLYPAIQVGRAFARDPDRDLQMMVASGLLISSAGFHDVWMVNGPISLEHDFAIVWAAAASVAIFATLFVRRFISALDTSEALTAELEQRVEEKQSELEENYQRLRALEAERVVSQERERLTAEIHDGIGGQLVSTLAMVEEGEATPDQLGDALRAALDDMRLVIHSLDAEQGDVTTLLGTVRARLGPRLARAGLELRWHIEDVPPVADFGPEGALHLMRIVQETITNALKHARARTLTVTTGTAPGADGRSGVFVTLADDGVGFPPGAESGAGRGLANMQRRAVRLGGELRIDSSAEGTTVNLWLPAETEADL